MTILILWTLLYVIPSQALPPEGLENFAFLGGKGIIVHALAGYHDPSWRTQYPEVGAYAGTPLKGNYFTAGARASTSPEWADRDAWFARYDIRIMGIQSISVKYAHETWRYISTGKESVGLEYNILSPFTGGAGGGYLAVGGYYRWLKQRWNENWSMPFNFNTKDQEAYYTMILGFGWGIGKGKSFWSVDLNYRDAFSYYHFDNVAFDATLNFDMGKTILRLYSGVRTSALYMGAGAITDSYAGTTLIFY